MFENIGEKLRTLARVTLLVGLVISLIAMIGIWITGGGLSGRGRGFSIFIFGLLTGGLGCFASWGLSLLIYGFGKLIDDTEHIRHNSEDIQYSTDVLRRVSDERRRPAKARPAQAEEE